MTSPTSPLLAELHERKGRAFRLWANATGDDFLRHEAHRAEKAAQTTREMHANEAAGPPAQKPAATCRQHSGCCPGHRPCTPAPCCTTSKPTPSADQKSRKKTPPRPPGSWPCTPPPTPAPTGASDTPRTAGLLLDQATSFCALTPDQVTEHTQLLIDADWLTEADIAENRLRGQLTERVLPPGGLL